jgi:hypothetical protein
MDGEKECGAGEQLHACGSRAGGRASGVRLVHLTLTCVSVLPRRRCCAMRFKSSASSSSGAVTPWSMRTAGRQAARGRSAVSPSTSIVRSGLHELDRRTESAVDQCTSSVRHREDLPCLRYASWYGTRRLGCVANTVGSERVGPASGDVDACVA